MKNIKRIIKEEINDFDWIGDIQPMEPEMEWLKDNFDNLEKVTYGDKTYYVDSERKPHFYYRDEEDGVVWINYRRIWSVLMDNFGLKYSEIQELIERWLDETYNLRGLTPLSLQNLHVCQLDETYNLRKL